MVYINSKCDNNSSLDMSMVLLGWVSRLYVSKEPVRSKVATSFEEDMERNEDF